MSIRSNVDRGGFNQRVEFERKRIERGPQGEVRESWEVLGGAWAKVDALKAGERYKDAAVTAVNAYTIWIRAEVLQALQLVPNDRLVWRGEPYDIRDIPDQQLSGRLVALFVQGGLNQG